MAIQFRDNIREIGMDAANIGFIEVARARVASKEPIHEYSDGPSSRVRMIVALFTRDELFLNNKSYCGIVVLSRGGRDSKRLARSRYTECTVIISRVDKFGSDKRDNCISVRVALSICR